MLVIYYYIQNDTKNLVASLNSIISQTCVDFEFHLINDNQDLTINKIIESISFAKIKKFFYLKSNKTINSGYYFSKIKQLNDGDYVWICNAGCVLQPDCVAKIREIIANNDSPVIEISQDANSTLPAASNQTIDITDFSKFVANFSPYVYNKLYAVSFLKSNGIIFSENQSQSLHFFYLLLSHTTQFLKVNDGLVKYYDTVDNYINVYEIILMAETIISENKTSKFWTDNLRLIEFYFMVYLIDIFVYYIFLNYTQMTPQSNAIISVKKIIENNFQTYDENEAFKCPNCLDKNISNFIANDLDIFANPKKVIKNIINFYGAHKKN